MARLPVGIKLRCGGFSRYRGRGAPAVHVDEPDIEEEAAFEEPKYHQPCSDDDAPDDADSAADYAEGALLYAQDCDDGEDIDDGP